MSRSDVYDKLGLDALHRSTPDDEEREVSTTRKNTPLPVTEHIERASLVSLLVLYSKDIPNGELADRCYKLIVDHLTSCSDTPVDVSEAADLLEDVLNYRHQL